MGKIAMHVSVSSLARKVTDTQSIIRIVTDTQSTDTLVQIHNSRIHWYNNSRIHWYNLFLLEGKTLKRGGRAFQPRMLQYDFCRRTPLGIITKQG